MWSVNTGLSAVCTFTVDILEKEEIVDRLSLLCILSCVTLHVSTSSLKLTPTLIYCAPDLLLFCHPDMFNKYCLAWAGYTAALQRCCCLSALSGDGLCRIRTSSNFKHPCTHFLFLTHAPRARRYPWCYLWSQVIYFCCLFLYFSSDFLLNSNAR